MFWMNFEIFMFSPQVIFIYEKGETCIFPKTKFLIFRTFEHNPRKFWVHIYHFYINSQLFSACSLPQHSMPKSQFMFESQMGFKMPKINVFLKKKSIYSLKKLPFEDSITKPCKNSPKIFRFEPNVYQWTLPAPFWHPSLVFSFHTCVLDRFFRFPNFL